MTSGKGRLWLPYVFYFFIFFIPFFYLKLRTDHLHFFSSPSRATNVELVPKMSVFDVLVIGTKHTSSTPAGRRHLVSTQPQARPEDSQEDNDQEASLSPGSGSGMSYLGSEAGLTEFLEMVPLAGGFGSRTSLVIDVRLILFIYWDFE